jgi:hypothetical protein
MPHIRYRIRTSGKKPSPETGHHIRNFFEENGHSMEATVRQYLTVQREESGSVQRSIDYSTDRREKTVSLHSNNNFKALFTTTIC